MSWTDLGEWVLVVEAKMHHSEVLMAKRSEAEGTPLAREEAKEAQHC